MAIATAASPASFKRFGDVLSALSRPDGAREPSGDTFTRTAPPPPSAGTAAGNAKVKAGPTTKVGKIAETAYVGTLGFGAAGVAYGFSKGMLSMFNQIGPLTLKNVVKQSLGAGGMAVGLPMSIVQDSFGYKRGAISAKRYWGNVASDTVGWGVWWGAAMVTGSLLGGVGFIPVAAGFLAGTFLYSAFDRTAGRQLSNLVAKAVPAGVARKGADLVVKGISAVLNPLGKYAWQPIKRHLGLFLATGGAAALFFGIKGNGKMALKGAGAMGVSMPGQMIGDRLLDKVVPPMTPVKGVDLIPGKGQVFDTSDGTVGVADDSQPRTAARTGN